MKYSLDHIGIAVAALEEAIKLYEDLGFQLTSVEEVASEKVRVGMIELKNDCRLELLEALSDDSAIAQFLRKKGPGIHHICMRVENLKSTMEELKGRGVQLIYSEPRIGAHDCWVNFIHPRSAGGVLIELSQRRD